VVFHLEVNVRHVNFAQCSPNADVQLIANRQHPNGCRKRLDGISHSQLDDANLPQKLDQVHVERVLLAELAHFFALANSLEVGILPYQQLHKLQH